MRRDLVAQLDNQSDQLLLQGDGGLELRPDGHDAVPTVGGGGQAGVAVGRLERDMRHPAPMV